MLFNNEKAVSPIVATLVLVVVAIAGAAAVGTIMGSFSSDVSGEADVGDAMSASSTEILIAGSTTVQPVSELLAEAYMEQHQGVKVTVQGGGSGAGVASAGMGIVDIGAASRDPKDAEMTKYPNVNVHKIGGSAVVLIASSDLSDFELTPDEVAALYNGTDDGSSAIGSTVTLYQRAEESGTEDTFVEWLQDEAYEDFEINESATSTATGNAGVLAAVEGHDDSIGFVDYGFAANGNVKIVGLDFDGKIYSPVEGTASSEDTQITKKNLGKELGLSSSDSDANKYYPHGLTRPLNYITDGEPNSMKKSFIDFAMSPGAIEYFEECGYFAITEI